MHESVLLIFQEVKYLDVFKHVAFKRLEEE